MKAPENEWIILQLGDKKAMAFTYTDREAGFSAKGGYISSLPTLEEVQKLSSLPGITIRLDPPGTFDFTVVSPSDKEKYNLPDAPKWYREFFAFDPVWQRDEKLKHLFHPDYPNDLQVLVHDGGPRISKNPPELIWARIIHAEDGHYLASALNQPHNLKCIKEGSPFKFITAQGADYPILVTDLYLLERKNWRITPCNECGMDELFDTPSALIAAIFPNTPEDSTIQTFTSFCPLCGGVQVLNLNTEH